MIQEQNILLTFIKKKKREIRVQKDKYILLPPFQNVGHFDFSSNFCYAPRHMYTMNLEK